MKPTRRRKRGSFQLSLLAPGRREKTKGRQGRIKIVRCREKANIGSLKQALTGPTKPPEAKG